MQPRERAFEMDGLLARAAARGTTINTWIDVGASDGSWALRARRHFPAANFLLFEPLEERRRVVALVALVVPSFGLAHAGLAVRGAVAGVVVVAVLGSGGFP